MQAAAFPGSPASRGSGGVQRLVLRRGAGAGVTLRLPPGLRPGCGPLTRVEKAGCQQPGASWGHALRLVSFSVRSTAALRSRQRSLCACGGGGGGPGGRPAVPSTPAQVVAQHAVSREHRAFPARCRRAGVQHPPLQLPSRFPRSLLPPSLLVQPLSFFLFFSVLSVSFPLALPPSHPPSLPVK